MRQQLRWVLFLAVLCACPSLSFAQNDTAPDPRGGRQVLATRRSPCSVSEQAEVANIATAYFRGNPDLKSRVEARLRNCGLFNAYEDFVVVVFVGRPTVSGDRILVHLLFDVQAGKLLSALNLPGVSRVKWVYFTDGDPHDLPPVLQFVVTPAGNPIVGQIGKLAATILESAPIPPVRAQTFPPGVPRPQKQEVNAFAYSKEVDVLRRSTIAETIYAVVYDDDLRSDEEVREAGDEPCTTRPYCVPKQVSGEATFTNTPKSFVTINAGVGIITGPLKGAQRLKVDGDNYAADPIPRLSTMAGVTWHVPYDSATITPSWQERLGLATFGVLQPAGGFAIGPTFGWRGFSFSALKAFMWVDTSPNGEAPGASVPTGSQLKLGRTEGFVLGGTYAF